MKGWLQTNQFATTILNIIKKIMIAFSILNTKKSMNAFSILNNIKSMIVFSILNFSTRAIGGLCYIGFPLCYLFLCN